MSRRRGGGLRVKKKARGFMCGCGGSKSVSISDGSEKQSPMATPPTAATSTPTTTTMSFTTATSSRGTRRAGKKKMAAPADATFYCAGDTTSDAHSSSVDESTPSLAALLRQLRDLERSVHFLDPSPAGAGAATDAAAAANYKTTNNNNSCGGGGSGGRRHQRTLSDGGGASRRVEESVAVVKESADPLGDFRRSMLQMIVENEIVGGAELRELVHRFLSLNSPQHHHIILRAFAEIWEEVFAGYDRTPDFLAAHRRRNRKKPARAC